MISKEQGAEKAEGASETLIFKIDVPANRFVASPTQCFVAMSDNSSIGQSNYGLTLNKWQQKLFHLY